MIDMLSKWDLKFLELAALVATWSKDPHIKVGAVVVNTEDTREYYTGYNGFPRGVEDNPEMYLDKKIKHPLTIHAEMNAILNAQRRLEGYTMYTTRFPCIRCAMATVQSGVTTIVTPYPESIQMQKHSTEYELTLRTLSNLHYDLRVFRGHALMSVTLLQEEVLFYESRRI